MIDVRSSEKFTDKELIWDDLLWGYSTVRHHTRSTFPLINIDDLTQLVYQLDENNWKTPEMIKKFGLFSKLSLEEIKAGTLIEEEEIKRIIRILEENKRKVFIIFDNLANQILARCVIVANRLTHGEDKVSEENIMSLAFLYQSCYQIPQPKIFSEFPKGAEARQKLQDLANQALNGNRELLSRFQNLPYLNPKYKLKD